MAIRKSLGLIAFVGLMATLCVLLNFTSVFEETRDQKNSRLGDKLVSLLDKEATTEEVVAALGGEWKPEAIWLRDGRLVWKMEPIYGDNDLSRVVIFLEFDPESKRLVEKSGYTVN